MLTSFQVPNALAPADSVGPLYLPMTLDFSTESKIVFDLLEEQNSGVFDKPQTLYVDNRNNPNAVKFTFAGTNYIISVPAYAGGLFPVFVGGIIQVTAETTPGVGIVIPIAFINVPMPLTQWGPTTVNIGTLTVTTDPAKVTYTDHSGTTAGNVSEQMMAANANRKQIIVQNPANNAESLWINFTSDAQAGVNSYEIPPGAVFNSGPGAVSTEKITMFSVSPISFVAKEG